MFTDTYKEWLRIGDDLVENPKDPKGPKIPNPKGTPNTKLAPFASNEENELYLPESTSYKHTQFGYTYPELQPWEFETREQYLQAIRERIDRLYTTTSTMALLLPENRDAAEQQMKMMTVANFELENIPAPLLELAPVEVIKRSTKNVLRGIDDYNNATFGVADEDLSWNSEDYVANILYERYVSTRINECA